MDAKHHQELSSDLRQELFEYAEAEALDAGLDEGTADAVAHMSLDCLWFNVDGTLDRDHFEDMVRDVIQGHAMP